jgi:hypothetical protein
MNVGKFGKNLQSGLAAGKFAKASRLALEERIPAVANFTADMRLDCL